MKTKIKLIIGIALAILLGWGAWKAWSAYQVIKTVKENVPGVTVNTDGIKWSKEDGRGNKFNIQVGPKGVSIVGNKNGKPIEIKVDASGMNVDNGGKQMQIPLDELKKQLEMMNSAKKESAE